MSLHAFTTFSKKNRRIFSLLIASHLLWSAGIYGLWAGGCLIATNLPGWSVLFIALQLFAAAQLLLPALLLQPETRTRSFYLLWGIVLGLCIWLLNQLRPGDLWQPLLVVIKSGFLLLVATIIAAALARYVRHLWEIVPICVVMTLADFASWVYGPTALFTRQIEHYRLTPAGPPPVVDMILIKLAFPGEIGLAPLFGISDWIMVVFFAIVAQRHVVNDNLIGPTGASLAQKGKIGHYLPVSVAALFIATILAQVTGRFIPALPLIAMIMLLWYAGRSLGRHYRRSVAPPFPAHDKDE